MHRMAQRTSPKASALLNLMQAPTEPSRLPETPTAEPVPAERKTVSSANAAPVRKPIAKARGTGKRVTLFLHERDRQLIRELMAYLAGQGRRVSESIVIKAALRVAKHDSALLRAHDDAAAQDQRFKGQMA
jgi:hypothetical protein